MGRLTRQQQREVLAAMIEEARYRTAQGLSVRDVKECVRQVRDDLKRAMRQGLTVQIAPEPEQLPEEEVL